ncbi:ankyrin repeat domain-containing protein [unidentified bacterial endosymbiont]|uniref:ankyrin repeat domain-containing protein n=1 Tax=unidentified bacterial endosymbiont TaxID=2355 RepID=UPI0020A1AED7|nr:ankyrin repeat domain-containing protein [unidentified bacterial endosymbiont]
MQIQKNLEKNEDLPLRKAALKGKLHEVNKLLKEGEDVNGLSPGNNTALMGAALNNHANVATDLIDKGAANISLINSKKKDAIDIACDAESYDFLNVIDSSLFDDEPYHTERFNKTPDNISICNNKNLRMIKIQEIENHAVKYRETLKNITSKTPLLTSAAVAVTAATTGIINTVESTFQISNASLVNQTVTSLAAFNPDNSENMGLLTMAAVGVAAVGLVGGLVWGTRTCLNLNKTVKNYDLNPHSTELSLIEHS